MTHETIDSKITQMELLEAQIKNLEALRDSIKAELKKELDDAAQDMIDTGINRIWYKPVSRNVVDNDKLKKDGIYNKYLKESISLQFKITKS